MTRQRKLLVLGVVLNIGMGAAYIAVTPAKAEATASLSPCANLVCATPGWPGQCTEAAGYTCAGSQGDICESKVCP